MLSLCLSLLAGSASAQIIQDFSSVVSASSTYFYGTWKGGAIDGTEIPNADFVQGVGVYDITGATATNADTSMIEFYFDGYASIGANGFLGVTAQALALNAASSFQIILLDSANKAATATFAASSFLMGSNSTAYSALSFGGGFNPNAVEFLRITGGIPLGADRFNFRFDKIEAVASAIPEPSTYVALAGLVALGAVFYRRRAKRV